MNEYIYQHYREDERPFIDGVYDWIRQVENTYQPYTTNFLTPRQVMIVKELVGAFPDISVVFSGISDQAERKRAVILSPYVNVQKSDFKLSLLEVNYPTKFGELSHGQILGTLMGSGVERELVGDIITDGKNWQIIVDETIADYFIQQITKIANIGVELIEIDHSKVLTPLVEWEEKQVFVSSLRLDALLANVYNLSRANAQTMIKQGRAKVNFTECDRLDELIDREDIVSLRGFGRFKINEIQGKTKKDNFRLEIYVLKK